VGIAVENSSDKVKYKSNHLLNVNTMCNVVSALVAIALC